MHSKQLVIIGYQDQYCENQSQGRFVCITQGIRSLDTLEEEAPRKALKLIKSHDLATALIRCSCGKNAKILYLVKYPFLRLTRFINEEI